MIDYVVIVKIGVLYIYVQCTCILKMSISSHLTISYRYMMSKLISTWDTQNNIKYARVRSQVAF